jgi:hypothetical protein
MNSIRGPPRKASGAYKSPVQGISETFDGSQSTNTQAADIETTVRSRAMSNGRLNVRKFSFLEFSPNGVFCESAECWYITTPFRTFSYVTLINEFLALISSAQASPSEHRGGVRVDGPKLCGEDGFLETEQRGRRSWSTAL